MHRILNRREVHWGLPSPPPQSVKNYDVIIIITNVTILLKLTLPSAMQYYVDSYMFKRIYACNGIMDTNARSQLL